MKALIVNDYDLAMEIAKPNSWGYHIRKVEMVSPDQDGINFFTTESIYIVSTNKKRLFPAVLAHDDIFYGTNNIYNLVLMYVNSFTKPGARPYEKINYLQEPMKAP